MQAGNGALSFLGYAGPVTYEMPVRAGVGRVVQAGYRGVLTLPPETARESFRAGAATLSLDDGKTCRIVIVGHAEGSGKAYFETVS